MPANERLGGRQYKHNDKENGDVNCISHILAFFPQFHLNLLNRTTFPNATECEHNHPDKTEKNGKTVVWVDRFLLQALVIFLDTANRQFSQIFNNDNYRELDSSIRPSIASAFVLYSKITIR